MREIALRGCLAVLMVVFAPTGALASDGSDLLREMKDRAEIEALMWRYVRALDTLDENAYAAVYTPDGSFISGSNTAKGHDALKKVVADVKKRRAEREAKGEKPTAMHHIITNTHLVFIDKDHARLNSYWMTVFAGVGLETPPRVAAAGRGVDELVRVNGQWLIRSRDVAPKD
jgi:uncharacterized protein (TIGR02246 family)